MERNMSNSFPREILNSDPVQLELPLDRPVGTYPGRRAFHADEAMARAAEAEEARIMLAIFRALGG